MDPIDEMLSSHSIIGNRYAVRGRTPEQNRLLEERQLGAESNSFELNSELGRVARARQAQSLEQQLWSRVHQPEVGCWMWRGPRSASGRGYLAYRGQRLSVQSLALALASQRPPGPVIATCGRALCCRPDHLREGTFVP